MAIPPHVSTKPPGRFLTEAWIEITCTPRPTRAATVASSRKRGLKCGVGLYRITPLMGRFLTEAWIEMLIAWVSSNWQGGRFLTEAWIEMKPNPKRWRGEFGRFLTEAWIEICSIPPPLHPVNGRFLTEAWIEISSSGLLLLRMRVASSRKRGLKLPAPCAALSFRPGRFLTEVRMKSTDYNL